ncbi:MAG: FkbM family methyltransferase [Oscillospiraceae bacterium]|nr:FkbM family methyltransferase [Oscillospiraceae bacterium]
MFSKLLNTESSWEKLKNSALPVVVYGTGNGADRVFDELERLNIKISAVAASDGFVRKRCFHGFEVKSISTLENEFGDFTVALAFASPLQSVIENIKALSTRHSVIMPSVPVYGDSIFNKDFLKSHLSEIENAYDLLADEKSKAVFESIINFQITGELSYTFECESDKSEAFSILELTDNENYLDLGAYRGDTVDEFLSYVNGYSHITAAEPDKKAFRKLTENCERLHNISLLNLAVWDKCGDIPFGGGKGRGSAVLDDGETISCADVDTLNQKYGIFTYIKADVEGAEKEFLDGAEKTLKEYKPKLNIAAYHRSEDIFYLVKRIHEINGEYKIYLRHHPHISFWDTNLYCI